LTRKEVKNDGESHEKFLNSDKSSKQSNEIIGNIENFESHKKWTFCQRRRPRLWIWKCVWAIFGRCEPV